MDWEPEMVLNVVFEHASVPAGGPQALRLLVDDVRQKFNPRPLAVDPGAILVQALHGAGSTCPCVHRRHQDQHSSTAG